MRRSPVVDIEAILSEIAHRSHIHEILLADYFSSIREETLAFELYLRVANADVAAREEALKVDADAQASEDKAVVLAALRAPRLPVFAMGESASRNDTECVCVDSFDGTKVASADMFDTNTATFALVEQRRPLLANVNEVCIGTPPCLANIYLGDVTLGIKVADAQVFSRSQASNLSVATTETTAALFAILQHPAKPLGCALAQIVLPLARLPEFGCLPDCQMYSLRRCVQCIGARGFTTRARRGGFVTVTTTNTKRPACMRAAHEQYAAWSAPFWAGYSADCAKRSSDAASCVTRAMVAVARRFDAGVGVKQDATQGLHWWRRAADAGSGDAQLELGAAYRDGHKGTRKQGAQAVAVRWLETAEKQGHEVARLALRDPYYAKLFIDELAVSGQTNASDSKTRALAILAAFEAEMSRTMAQESKLTRAETPTTSRQGTQNQASSAPTQMQLQQRLIVIYQTIPKVSFAPSFCWCQGCLAVVRVR